MVFFMRSRKALADEKAAFPHFPIAHLALCAACKGDDRTLGQSLQVDGQVEMIGLKASAQFTNIRRTFQTLFIDIHDFINIRLARQEGGKLLMHRPDNTGVRQVLPQRAERRQSMEHVAERAHLDDQYTFISLHAAFSPL